MISYAISSYCGSYIPKDESTCDKFTNSTSICCYLQGNFDGAPHSLCYPFERDFYYSLSRTVSLNSFIQGITPPEAPLNPLIAEPIALIFPM